MSRRSNGALFTACAVAYLAIATRINDGLSRTQFSDGAYSNFFDIQTRALLRGNLALPPNSIGIEAFVVRGREQMYFGLFPALLRLPVELLTDSFFGELTVLSSFLAWALFVGSAWALSDRVTQELWPEPGSRLTGFWLPATWKVVVALGTPMLMLAGPAWVFSEAILWGVAAATFFQYRLFRELQTSSLRNQMWLGAALLLAVLNRPTLGLGCLLATVAVAIVRSRRGIGTSELRLAGIAGISTLILVLPNMFRFGRLFGPPMERQLLSQIDEQRIRMLAYAGGDFVDVRYAPSNLVAYLRPDGFSISSRFPFIDGPRSVPTVYLDAVYDITYRTPSLIAVTPLLFGLGVWGSIVGVRAVRRDARIRRVAFLATVGVPAAATLLIWGFIAPRYLADFLPLLIPLSLLGLGGLSTVLDRSGRRLRAGALAIVAVLGCWSIAAGAALAVSSSYLTGPDGDAAELVRIQGRGSFWDSTPGRRPAVIDDFRFDRTNPPPLGTIAILGACEAAYLSSGEPVDPWLTLAYGPNEFRRVFEVTVAESPEPSSVRLATFTSAPPNDPEAPAAFELFLVVDEEGNVSLQLADEFGVVPYPLDVAPGDTFELGVTSDPVRKTMFFEVDGRTAGYGHYLTRSLYDADGQVVEFFPGDQQRGLDVRVLRSPPAPC